VVSHVLLGSVAQEIVGPEADVVVLIPNGVDPHLYEPSARDIERLNNADLVVINGLGLESSLEESLAGARAQQTPIFVATDHIDTHEAPKNHDHSESELHEGEVESDQHADEKVVGEHDGHLHSEDDPHFWTDPRLMAEVAQELGDAVTDLGLDIGDRALMLSERLLTFDQDMLRLAETLPVDRRVLVTGHESLGYFAERYGFEIIGTIIPGLTTGAEVSAANLAAVKDAIVSSGVGVIFTELGTSSSSARVLSDELGVDVVEISTHFIPEEALELGMGGDTYMKFIEMLVNSIVSALEK
jgi:zinc/manganese transport system substrate-binding protein